ncbi:MAG: histidine kinase dimerization/phospho-acceptor domain-containing protein, partial [Chitinophagaceae bacterium]
MRSATLKWIVLLSTIVVALIIVVQLYWLNQLYSHDQKQFDTNTLKAVRVLFDDMQLSNNPEIDLKKRVNHPDPNTFYVRVDKIPQKESLLHFVGNEFLDFGVLADCWVALHDGNTVLFSKYIPGAASQKLVFEGTEPVLTPKGYAYIHLYFPHREKFIIGELTSWIIGAVVLVVILICFAASLFFLYKQKTLNEIQKDFVNNFTHEFKTPLAVMKIASDVMINPAIAQQPERLLKYSLIIKEQTEHLQHQVE